MGRKKVVKVPAKKMSFEVSKNGVLTDKLSNIKQLMELMKGDEISKDNRFLISPKEKVKRMLRAIEATAPLINPKIKTDKKLDKKWSPTTVVENFGSTWKDIKAFAKRYEISNKDIMKYMASRALDRTQESTKRLSKALAKIQIKKSERASIIQNKKEFIKADKNLAQKKGEDDTTYQERLYQAVTKARRRTKK